MLMLISYFLDFYVVGAVPGFDSGLISVAMLPP